MTNVYEYDVFISYASEDKAYATELCEKLRSLRVKVWFDKANLRIGDSVLTTIGGVVSRSRFCVLILSEHYLKTGWAQEEMKLLLHLQFSSRERKILPLWHNITKNDVKDNSPFLMDIQALSTRGTSTDEIAHKILEVTRTRVSQNEPQFHMEKNNIFLFTPDHKIESPYLKKTLRPTKFKQSLTRIVRPPLLVQ